jgi:hypothetical protein
LNPFALCFRFGGHEFGLGYAWRSRCRLSRADLVVHDVDERFDGLRRSIWIDE